MNLQTIELARVIRQAMLAQDSATEFVSPDGREYRVDLNPEPGIRRRIYPMEASNDGLEIVNWNPAATRPSSFPPDAPFLAHLRTVTAVRDGGAPLAITAFVPSQRGPDLIDQLLASGRAAGWNDSALPDGFPSFLVKVREQHRGTTVRLIVEHQEGDGTGITVIDTPRGKGEQP